MRLSLLEVGDQKEALQKLAEQTQRSVVQPTIRHAAMVITSDCPGRDDLCELEAIFNAVKHGDPRVKGLERGVRYVADPRWADFFTAPHRTLQMCRRGSCAGDCDDQASLIAALAGAIGFKVGLRAWGPKAGDFVHVYAVATTPKRKPSKVFGMDTTVPDSYVGWEPPGGHTLTAWLE